jgi:hypothetical protein
MSFVKLAMACGLVAVAMGVSGCGIKAKPVAGSAHLNSAPGNHGYIDDPRVSHLACLQRNGFKYTLFDTRKGHLPGIQIGSRPSGPTVVFYPTDGIAEGVQLNGQAEAAEVIGAALLYPNQASETALSKIEPCIAQGVKG